VVAHRGASAVEAEHTLAAYARAIDDGADGLECDVRLTRDHHLVCVHDRTVDRTSTGRGALSALELADLEELDFGAGQTPAPAGAGEGGETPDRYRTGVLTLRRLLRTVTESRRPLSLAIETKHPTRYAGLVEQKLADLLGELGLTDSPNVTVMSFSILALRRMRARAPTIDTVWLFGRVPARYRDGSLPAGVSAAGPSLGLLRRHPTYVERVHAAGGQVHVWVANEPAHVDYVADLGVDVIITDRPRRVLAQLGR
jgi:glycerophosphoryl diester phosphodiesterase